MFNGAQFKDSQFSTFLKRTKRTLGIGNVTDYIFVFITDLDAWIQSYVLDT